MKFIKDCLRRLFSWLASLLDDGPIDDVPEKPSEMASSHAKVREAERSLRKAANALDIAATNALNAAHGFRLADNALNSHIRRKNAMEEMKE